MIPISRRAILIAAIGTGLLACSENPAGSQEKNPVEGQEAETLAVVGFHETVDRNLLERTGAVVFHVFESPPSALVRAPEVILAGLESEPAVAFVMPHAQDSIRAWVTFHDRPNVDDPVSAADSAAVRAAGGRIKYVYDLSDPSVAVVLPPSELEVLRSHGAVEKVVSIVGAVRPQ